MTEATGLILNAKIGHYRVRDAGNAVYVDVHVDRIPNQHGYGHKLESGNSTRAYARKVAQLVFTPAAGWNRVDVTAQTGSYHIGPALWRTYRVEGITAR